MQIYKYYVIDPWFTSISIGKQKVNAVFDTGNASYSYISCKKFPGIQRISIPVPEETLRYLNEQVCSMYGIDPLLSANMKELYKHVHGKIPESQYKEVMESLGFMFVQSGSGSLSIINLEIMSIELQVEGIPFPYRLVSTVHMYLILISIYFSQ